MDKRKLKKAALASTIVLVSIYLLFFVVFPFTLMGGPTSLYFIGNRDATTHNLTLKITDTSNKTLLSNTYIIDPDTTRDYARGFGWYPTPTLTPITWSQGEYTFTATLDGNHTISHTTTIQPTQTIWITITSNPLEPLKIGEAWI
jgi:hypothetical protein